MWDWIKRLFATRTQSPLEAAFLAQSQALIDLAKSQQVTLDRIVAAKYDRPFIPAQPSESSATMPAHYMNDDLSALLTVESDAEFLKMVEAK